MISGIFSTKNGLMDGNYKLVQISSQDTNQTKLMALQELPTQLEVSLLQQWLKQNM